MDSEKCSGALIVCIGNGENVRRHYMAYFGVAILVALDLGSTRKAAGIVVIWLGKNLNSSRVWPFLGVVHNSSKDARLSEASATIIGSNRVLLGLRGRFNTAGLFVYNSISSDIGQFMMISYHLFGVEVEFHRFIFLIVHNGGQFEYWKAGIVVVVTKERGSFCFIQGDDHISTSGEALAL
ncbi:hypothetical protein Tco_0435718 [Tanacetum coccineum]